MKLDRKDGGSASATKVFFLYIHFKETKNDIVELAKVLSE